MNDPNNPRKRLLYSYISRFFIKDLRLLFSLIIIKVFTVVSSFPPLNNKFLCFFFKSKVFHKHQRMSVHLSIYSGGMITLGMTIVIY